MDYTKINKQTFPPKPGEEPKKKELRTIRGKVKTRKQPLIKRFVDTFVGEDVGNVGDYLLHDVLIPGIKKIFYESVTGGTEMALWGERTGRSSRVGSNSTGSKVSYNTMSTPSYAAPPRGRASSPKELYDDVIFENKWQADEVYAMMFDIIREYDFCSVLDLRTMCKLDTRATDDNYGWDEDTIQRGEVKRVRDGYVIDLPSPKARD